MSLTAAPTLAAHEAEHAALARLPGDTPLRTLLYVEDNPANLELVEQIIALSANALTRDIEKALAAGFFNYLTKPIKVDAFLDALDVALKYAQTARATHKEHP